MLLGEQVREIEMLAVRGLTVSSLLRLTCTLQECSTRDIESAACALESYFEEILRTLKCVNSNPHS
jgi:hypothetical protein